MNKQNRYLFIYTFISFLISFLTSFLLDYHQTLKELLRAVFFIFIPFFTVLLISIIGYFTDAKFHKATIIITRILNIFIIIFIQIFYPLVSIIFTAYTIIVW